MHENSTEIEITEMLETVFPLKAEVLIFEADQLSGPKRI